jgi:chorismate mutase
MTLTRIRDEIDAIDGEILSLLHRRLLLARRTRALKRRLADPAREREVFDRLTMTMRGYPLLRPEFVLGLYGQIMKESRHVQRRGCRGKDNEEMQP